MVVIDSNLFRLTDFGLCLFVCRSAFEKGGGDQEVVSVSGEMGDANAEVDVQRCLARDPLEYILFLLGFA
jgi:hypothetical protein